MADRRLSRRLVIRKSKQANRKRLEVAKTSHAAAGKLAEVFARGAGHRTKFISLQISMGSPVKLRYSSAPSNPQPGFQMSDGMC